MLIPKKKRYLRITTFPLNVLPPDIDALISGDWSERWCNRASEDIFLKIILKQKFRILWISWCNCASEDILLKIILETKV